MTKILIIEDEPYLQELYEKVLSRAGFDVSIAIDGQQGVSMAQSMPDLILLDIMMPKMTGIDVLKKLMTDEKTKNMSIVLLTNLGQESIIKEALKAGARGYLMKLRVSPYDLVDRVKEFIANPNLRTSLDTLDLE